MNPPAKLWRGFRSQNHSPQYSLTKLALSAENYGGVRDLGKKETYLPMHHDLAARHTECPMSKLFQGLFMLRYLND